MIDLFLLLNNFFVSGQVVVSMTCDAGCSESFVKVLNFSIKYNMGHLDTKKNVNK